MSDLSRTRILGISAQLRRMATTIDAVGEALQDVDEAGFDTFEENLDDADRELEFLLELHEKDKVAGDGDDDEDEDEEE